MSLDIKTTILCGDCQKSFIWFHRDSAFCFVGYKHKIKERNNHECIKIISSFQTLNCIVDCNVVDAQNDLK